MTYTKTQYNTPNNTKVYLSKYTGTQKIIAPTLNKSLKSRVPSLGHMMDDLPAAPAKITTMVEIMEQDTLVAGCNGGDNTMG